MSDRHVQSDDDVSAGGRPGLTDEERAEAIREELKRMRVADLLRDMLVSLITVGYQKMGLTAETRELRDLGDARVAIEGVRRLIEVLEAEGDAQAETLRSTLAAMQIQYARAAMEEDQSRPQAEPESAGDATAGAATAGEQAAESRRSGSGSAPSEATAGSGRGDAAAEPPAASRAAGKRSGGKPVATTGKRSGGKRAATTGKRAASEGSGGAKKRAASAGSGGAKKGTAGMGATAAAPGAEKTRGGGASRRATGAGRGAAKKPGAAKKGDA